MKKTMLKILVCLLLSILCISALSSCKTASQQPMGKLATNFHSIDDLIKNSPVIAIGRVTGNNDELEYGHTTFALTQFTVETTIRGEVSGNIIILQTQMAEDPYIHKGDQLLLFLKKYIGPITADAYLIRGLYQGQYKIEGSKIIKIEGNILSGSQYLKSIDILKSRVALVGYEPTPSSISK